VSVKIGKDLVAAAATPMVLGILAEGESYGYAILQRIAELSDGELEWSDGMLYPLLHRLERLGHIEASWSASPTGRPRKHYRLSPTGAAVFAEQRRQWSVVSTALQKVWADRDGDRSPFTLGGAPA
jgi:DNA-binding PadR family transcriptional regulator